jgi:hypothetical protein
MLNTVFCACWTEAQMEKNNYLCRKEDSSVFVSTAGKMNMHTKRKK